MKRWVAILGLGALLVVMAIASGQPKPAAAQTAPRDQAEPSVYFDEARKEFVLVWSEDRGAGSHLYAKRIRQNLWPIGGAVTGDWEATGPTAPMDQKGEQHSPAVRPGLLVWSEKVPGGTDFDLYAQRLYTNGRTYGEPRMIAGGAGDQKYPAVVNTPEGWLVVWSENTSDAGDVMGVRLTVALTPRGTPFAIAKSASVAEDPAIAVDVSEPNRYLVVWTDDRSGNKDIYGTRVASSGLPRTGSSGSQFPVVATAANEYAPYLVANPSQQFEEGPSDPSGLLLWTVDADPDGPNIMVQRQHLNGYGIGKPYLLAGGPGVQGWPAADFSRGRDEWLVAWSADAAAGTLDVVGSALELNGYRTRSVMGLATD